MLLLPLTLSALLPFTLAASSAPAQLRLYPSPSTTESTHAPLALSAPQANAVLAHHLGVAQYEKLPITNGDRTWEQALGDSTSWEQGQKVVILLECGKEGCEDFIPETFAASTPYELPSLPVHSWTAAITLHLHRLATSLGLPLDSPVVVGLDSFVHGLKSISGWTGWVGEELGQRIGWEGIEKSVKAAVEPIRSNLGLLTDVDLLDESAKTLVNELESLTSLVDTFAASSSDDGPQGVTPQIVAVHIKGIKDICAAHSRSSETYQRAASLLRQTLTATLASLSASQSSAQEPTFVLLTLPPYQAPFLRKRAAWLSPFASASSRYTSTHRSRSATPAQGHSKRSTVFSPAADAGRKVRRAAATPQPIVPSSRRCFESEAQLKNLTANCLGRGVGVQGLSTRTGECWVCSCGKTNEGGKVKSWAGEGCEKEDLSGDFVLLFFSALGLLLVLFVSVTLLYNVGTGELPGTLASVGSNGGGSKRD